MKSVSGLRRTERRRRRHDMTNQNSDATPCSRSSEKNRMFEAWGRERTTKE